MLLNDLDKEWKGKIGPGEAVPWVKASATEPPGMISEFNF